VTRLGAVFLPQWAPERLRPVAEAADQAGLDELWLWEDCFWESGIATASAALAWTSRLKVGVGLLPVPLRNVAITAMEVATLYRLFPGRVQVGIGHGVQDWMAQVGAKVDSPVTLLREYLGALKALLAGETVTTHGRYVTLDEVKLVWPPQEAPIFVGAVGPRTLRLSGSDADGTILTGGTTPGQLAKARELIGDPAQPVVVYLHAATGPDAEVRLAAEGVRWGYESLDDVAVYGDAAHMAAGIRRWVHAGADTVVLQPTPDDPDPEGFMRFVAEEVKPAL